MTVSPSGTAGSPRFSIVSAVHDVARYLPDFIASLEGQTAGLEQVEVVAVDDGSTDGSLALLQEWAARRPGLVRVLTKTNGGQATARNLGLDHARGEWVTFTDPDDVLEPDYLAEVDRFITEHPEAPVVATNLVLQMDATGEVEDLHPLRYRFGGKARVRDLENNPAFFFVSAPAGFYQRARIEELGLRFDPEIRPNFEDGHFAGRYLLSLPQPLVGFVPGAVYRYRKRADSSSTLDRGLVDPGRFTDVVERGYLDLLRRATESQGSVPAWLQNVLLYELSWLVSPRVRATIASSPAVMAVADRFHELVGELSRHLDHDAVIDTAVRRMPRLWREVLLHSYEDAPWRAGYALLGRLDSAQGLVKVTYCYTGEAPQERFISNGVRVQPSHATVRDHRWLGRVVMHERIAWVVVRGPLKVQLDGRDLELAYVPPRRTTSVLPRGLRENIDHVGVLPDHLKPRPEPEMTPATRVAAKVGRRVSQFKDAWVLMDRVHDAGDNGQRLFEYLRAHRPEINAWFVVEKGTPAWDELRPVHGPRVVAYGSVRWQLLMMSATNLLSSHADQAVVAPDLLLEKGFRPTWRFTFLQHGVIKDDLSSWLNPKTIDTFVTSTRAEFDSIEAPHTNYVFTDREVVLTGLPRFDRLREVGLRHAAPEQRDLVLLAPTWRDWLTLPIERDSQRRELGEDFFTSEFARRWLEILESDHLRDLARDHGVQVGFLPHPNLQSVLHDYPAPDHVARFTFDHHDVQELFARAAVLVTDYSSMAFNSAYIDRAVVYYQFDRHLVLGGAHIGEAGYFDYDRDGFGPVTGSAEEAVAAVAEVLDAGRVPPATYQARIDEAFTLRDGRCCERVTDAVLASMERRPVVPAP